MHNESKYNKRRKTLGIAEYISDCHLFTLLLHQTRSHVDVPIWRLENKLKCKSKILENKMRKLSVFGYDKIKREGAGQKQPNEDVTR